MRSEGKNGMLLLSRTRVMIPYASAETEQTAYVSLTLEGTLNHRRLRRIVRRFIKLNFGTVVSFEWIRLHCKVFKWSPVKVTQSDIEMFIERLTDATDSEDDSERESSTVDTSAEPLRTVSD